MSENEMSEDEKEIARLTAIIEAPKIANLIIRAVSKWVLEFLRNCMVVAALAYLAQKSGNWWMIAVAGLGGFALFFSCYTYVEPFKEHIWEQFRLPRETRMQRILSVGLITLLFELVTYGIMFGLWLSINKIVEIQRMPT
jgi:hypothetical protein